jgi:hypothetical protein
MVMEEKREGWGHRVGIRELLFTRSSWEMKMRRGKGKYPERIAVPQGLDCK